MSANNGTAREFVGGFLGVIAMSAAAGILVAVGVTPALAVSSIAVSNTIGVFEKLPEYLAIDELSQKSNIFATGGDGSPVLLASFYDQNRVEVASSEISPFVKDAVVASEDPRFYEHGGVDLEGTVKGAIKSFGGREVRGGSSVTQQYIKNVLVQKCELIVDEDERDKCILNATGTTPARKIKEMRWAIGLEKKYSKDEILTAYLNITGYGGTVYGIEAAANYYFSTTAANLTLPQAASLIAMVQNPAKRQLDKPDSETNGAANGYAANKERRDYILEKMLLQGKITADDYAAAVAVPVEPAIREPSTGCQTAGGSAYFCDYVTYLLKTDPTFGDDEDTRLTNFRRGGYDVYTSLDLDLQIAAEGAIRDNVPQTYDGWDVGSVITSVQVGTGRVLAMAQNKIYSQDDEVLALGPQYEAINYNTDYNQGNSGGFQPGSTYKVFTLAEWLKEGHTLNERVDSKRKTNWGTFKDSCDGPQSYSDFNPKNDASEPGVNYSALESTINSINTGFIGMAKQLDLCGIGNTAAAFKVHRADGDPLKHSAGTVLGTEEVAPLSMAVAFAGIANNGMTCSPIAIDKIVGPDGTEIAVPVSTCDQSVEPRIAAGMVYAMKRVLTSGSGGESYRNTSPRVPMIGKTGTTDGNKDTWMSGASSKVATVVGVVSVVGEINQRNTYFDSGQAALARHRMWPAVMSVANAKYGGDDFAEATWDLIQAPQVNVPDLRGKTMADAKSVLEAAGFNVVDGGITQSEMPVGTVAKSDPAGGTSTGRGSTVTIFSSDGVKIVVPPVVPVPAPGPNPGGGNNDGGNNGGPGNH